MCEKSLQVSLNDEADQETNAKDIIDEENDVFADGEGAFANYMFLHRTQSSSAQESQGADDDEGECEGEGDTRRDTR